MTFKQKLLEIICPIMTSMIRLMHKVKMKGAQKTKVYRSKRSTKREPSYFDHVDILHSIHDISSRKKEMQSKVKSVQQRRIPILD